jgi:hypothetical protein
LFWQVPNIFVTTRKKTLNFLNNSNFQVKVLNLYNIQPMNLIVGPIQLVFNSIHNAPFAFCLQYFMKVKRKTGLPRNISPFNHQFSFLWWIYFHLRKSIIFNLLEWEKTRVYICTIAIRLLSHNNSPIATHCWAVVVSPRLYLVTHPSMQFYPCIHFLHWIRSWTFNLWAISRSLSIQSEHFTTKF